MNKFELALIKILDEQLCSDIGLCEPAYNHAFEVFENDMEILEILNMADATDGIYYFPEWHPGIENSLRVDCGSRNEFWSELYKNA